MMSPYFEKIDSSTFSVPNDFKDDISIIPVNFFLVEWYSPTSFLSKFVNSTILSFHWLINWILSVKIKVLILSSEINAIAKIVLPNAVGATKIPFSFSFKASRASSCS